MRHLVATPLWLVCLFLSDQGRLVEALEDVIHLLPCYAVTIFRFNKYIARGVYAPVLAFVRRANLEVS